jgi:two-component system chemotaxis response regulator CheY
LSRISPERCGIQESVISLQYPAIGFQSITTRPVARGLNLENLRILVVDDNTHVRTLVRTILHALGIRDVDVASDGMSGFEAFIRLEYDIIITDLEMKPLTRIEFVDLVRTSRKSPNPYIPIVMVTAFTDKERVTKARDHGVTEFLAKPFTFESLLSRLTTIIEKPRPFIRTADYFGPDRRRHIDAYYSGPERRKTEAQTIEPKSKIALVDGGKIAGSRS